MERSAKLNSRANIITNPLLSHDIRMTAAWQYAFPLTNLDTRPAVEIDQLAQDFGTHLLHFLQIAQDRSEMTDFRILVLEEALGRAVKNLTVAASNQEGLMLAQSEHHIAFSKASFSVEPSVKNHVRFSTALRLLNAIIENKTKDLVEDEEDHVRVINSARRLREIIGSSCIQFFPDSISSEDKIRFQGALLPRDLTRSPY